MSFLLRAVVMIGVLSYFAIRAGGPGGRPADEPVTVGSLSEQAAAVLDRPLSAARDALPVAWGAVPSDARERLARDALAELTRRVGPPSRDTLAEADRRPPWRGVAPR